MNCYVNSGDCSVCFFLVVLSLAWGSFLTCTYRLVLSQSLQGALSRCLELSAWAPASSLIFCCRILTMLASLNLVSSNQQNHWVLFGFPQNVLQPRNASQLISWVNNRAVSLGGKTPFVLIYWLYKLRKNIRKKYFLAGPSFVSHPSSETGYYLPVVWVAAIP